MPNSIKESIFVGAQCLCWKYHTYKYNVYFNYYYHLHLVNVNFKLPVIIIYKQVFIPPRNLQSSVLNNTIEVSWWSDCLAIFGFVTERKAKRGARGETAHQKKTGTFVFANTWEHRARLFELSRGNAPVKGGTKLTVPLFVAAISQVNEGTHAWCVHIDIPIRILKKESSSTGATEGKIFQSNGQRYRVLRTADPAVTLRVKWHDSNDQRTH